MGDVTQLLKVKLLKVIFLLCLISICFFQFNFQSIKRFLDDEVIIHESVEKHDALKPPAITVCPKKWKPESGPQLDAAHYENHCGNASTREDFEACVTNKTFSLEEMIQCAMRGLNQVEDLTDPQLWTSDVTFAVLGRCYTLDYDQLFTINPLKDGIALIVVENNDYYIYFSEPDFHFIRAQPLLTVPVTMVALHGLNSSITSIMLKMVRTEELNRLEAP